MKAKDAAAFKAQSQQACFLTRTPNNSAMTGF
jgi:hypothetical protein